MPHLPDAPLPSTLPTPITTPCSFVLLSESDVPLYDPLTFWQQLVWEDKSRVNVCRNAAPTDTRRWTWRMSVRAKLGVRLQCVR